MIPSEPRGVNIPQSEGLILPSDPVDEHTLHPHQQSERTLVDQDGSFQLDREDEEHDEEVTAWKVMPWWKRPSPYWSASEPAVSEITSLTTQAG